MFFDSNNVSFLINLLITNILNKECRVLSMDCSPLILFSSITLLYIFKDLKFYSKSINFVAKSVLAVYLLDDLRPWVNSFVNLQDHAKSSNLILYLLSFSTIMLILSVVIDKTRQYIFGGIETAGIKKISVYISNKMGKYFMERIN